MLGELRRLIYFPSSGLGFPPLSSNPLVVVLAFTQETRATKTVQHIFCCHAASTTVKDKVTRIKGCTTMLCVQRVALWQSRLDTKEEADRRCLTAHDGGGSQMKGDACAGLGEWEGIL